MNAAAGSAVVIASLALTSPEYVPVLVTTLQAAVEPTTAIKLVLPIDIVELVRAIFFGLAALCVPLATVYIMIVAARSKRAEVFGQEAIAIAKTTSKQIDGLLAERDLAKVAEGEGKGAATAAVVAEALKEGQRQGAETERASVAAATPSAPPITAPNGSPMPVADARVGSAVDRMAEAAGHVADTADKLTEAKKS